MTGTRTDETPIYGEGESFKTGSATADERREAFVDWLLTPVDMREPKTKQAFADQWGVSRQTLHNDMRDPTLQRQLGDRARAVAKMDRLPAVMDSLYRIATGENADGTQKTNRFGEVVFPSPSSSVSAANTLLGWIDDTKELREGEVDFAELTDEQLTEAVLTLLKKRDQKPVDAES